jgi:hypothetical protein
VTAFIIGALGNLNGWPLSLARIDEKAAGCFEPTFAGRSLHGRRARQKPASAA